MDDAKKSTSEYKKSMAQKVLDLGFNGDCSRVQPSNKVATRAGKGILDNAVGISIAGKETNISVPGLGITLDAGKDVNQYLERNLVISHYDDDHSEGVGLAICNAINDKKDLDIVVPSWKEHPDMKRAIKTFLSRDKNHVVKIHVAREGKKVRSRDGTMFEAFKTYHSPESLGYAIWKKHGKAWTQEMTFTGDIDPGKMDMKIPQVLGSKTLIIEDTWAGGPLPFLGPVMDVFTSHASTYEIRDAMLGNDKIKTIGIIHLPPISSCTDVESDIKEKLGSLGKEIYYLQSCKISLLDTPESIPSRFKRVV